jgi:hypothetical protein
MYMMKRKELERINKEFLTNQYERRFRISQDVVVSVIVGEDHVNSEMNRQNKEQKVFYEKLMMVRNFDIYGSRHKLNNMSK